MYRTLVRCLSTSSESREIRIPVSWGHIAGKWWGPLDKRPILAMHGWQDNCGTFDRLIPLLNSDTGILAIDLPGHGLSSRLPIGMYYHNIKYPMVVQLIKRFYNWDTVTLMGHSLGAISSYVYTMLYPQFVDYLICVDGLKPLYKKNNTPRMAEGLQELIKYNDYLQRGEEPPTYTAQELNAKIPSGIAPEHYHYILNRNISKSEKDPNRYYFSRDPRLKARLIINWPQEDLLEGARRIQNPMLLLKFTKSGYFEDKENFYQLAKVLQETSKDFQLHYVEGTHYVHLNNPETISDLINEFIAKHDNVDRSMTQEQLDLVQQSVISI